MSESAFEQQHLIAALDTSLPAIGLSLVVILCIYVAMRAYKEFTSDSNMKTAMYDQTGISGKYEYKLPTGEQVRISHYTTPYISLLVELPAAERVSSVFEEEWRSSTGGRAAGDNDGRS